ncbi:MAG TPA: DedA family protein [Limnochordia bacterium]|nr:DedA family protein [Limnochordia bacterium]
MLAWAKALVATLGYPGLFVALLIDGFGVPFPGQTLLAFTGFLASEGVLGLFSLLAVAWAGGYVGTFLAFVLVRYWGEAGIERLARRVPMLRGGKATLRALSDRLGLWSIVIGRFLPTAGNTGPYFAAMGRVSLLKFALVDALGVALWADGPVLAGYWLGEEWQRLLRLTGPFGWAFLAGAALAALIAWVVFKRGRVRA